MKEMNMEFKQLWPTTIGSGKFDVDGLVEHIFTNYNLTELKGEVDGGNIFKDNSDVMNKFKALVHNKFNDYLRNSIDKSIEDFMIFPSFTYHHVNPYYSTLRICVPVDLYLYRG